MRYFITGATGFIGGQIARQLLAAGHQVVVLARNPEKAGDLARLGAEIRHGDITEPESLREPMRGADGVFHTAGWYEVGVRDTRPAVRINVDGTRNVLAMMRELAIPKGVYTSSCAVFSNTGGKVVDESYRFDGKHLSEYDRTKWVAHYEVAEPMIREGLPLVIVQPGGVYGPADHSSLGDLLRQYLSRTLPIVPLGMGICLSHVEDDARGHILAMDKGQPGQSYILSGPPYRLLDLLRLCQTITGIPLPLMKAPPSLLKLSAVLMRPISRVVSLPALFHPETLRVSAGVTYWGDDAKARRELGWQTRPLDEGLRETLAYELRQMGREARFDGGAAMG